MNAEEFISPTHVKSEVERIFNTIVTNCGNVHLELRYIPFEGQAGGEDVLGGEGASVVILTIPQLEGAWQKVFTTFLDPWFKFPQIKSYIEKNDLIKFLVQDDCETKSQIWMQFKDLLINWGYNEVMNAVAKKVRQKTNQTKQVKPVYKNKAVVGTAIATPIAALINIIYHALPPEIGTVVIGIIAFVLSVAEHVSYSKALKEVEKYSLTSSPH